MKLRDVYNEINQLIKERGEEILDSIVLGSHDAREESYCIIPHGEKLFVPLDFFGEKFVGVDMVWYYRSKDIEEYFVEIIKKYKLGDFIINEENKENEEKSIAFSITNFEKSDLFISGYFPEEFDENGVVINVDSLLGKIMQYRDKYFNNETVEDVMNTTMFTGLKEIKKTHNYNEFMKIFFTYNLCFFGKTIRFDALNKVFLEEEGNSLGDKIMSHLNKIIKNLNESNFSVILTNKSNIKIGIEALKSFHSLIREMTNDELKEIISINDLSLKYNLTD